MNIVLLSANVILMLTIPFVVGRLIASRRKVSWELFVIGGVSFIVSQLGHLPFNAIMTPRVISLTEATTKVNSTLLLALFLGLSAGIFEETTRYLTYRLMSKNNYNWSSALMIGAGHGGIEALLLGLVAAANLVILFGYRAGYFQALLSVEDGPIALRTIDTYLAAPWYDTILGAIERVSALAIHISLSIMVLQVITKKRKYWFFLAVAWHALVDGLVVVGSSWWGIYITEAIVAFAAVASVCFIYLLRERDTDKIKPDPLPELALIEQVEIELSSDKLEDTRFM
jgi:uncharacterized membrane protein YhfC